MAPRRPRKKICIDSQREKPNSPMHSNLSPTLRKLLSAITTPGGMKAPVLKSLYCLLFHLSTGPQNRVDENDLQAVCDFIFKELSVMFDNIISPVYDISVFLDELLVHGRLKAIFKRIGQITYPSEPLFMPQPTDKGISSKKRQCDIGILAELVSTCFLLSFSREDAIEAFLDRLFCACNKDFEFFKAQGMSLTGAISLLLHPMFFSAPKIVQAHLVSSVYEAMSSVMDIPKLKLNCKLLNYCISVFEKSMDMYMKHMSCVWTKGHPLSICASFVEPHTHGGYCPLPFASYIMPSTLEKINSLITRLEGSSDSFLCNHFFALKSDLASSCIAYVKECQCLLDQLCRPDVFSIVNCLIVRASESFDETRMPAIRDISLQDICLLVAVLKLMSISLLHAISCLRNKESCGSFKTLKDYSLCKEYMSIVCASSCFSKCQLHFPVQEFLFGIMETNSIKHKDFMMMLVHFSGLLAFSFLNRFDYLAKGCLLTITAVLNLFVLEDGYLDELRSLVVSGPYSVSSALPLALVNQRPSIKVASKFQNMQNLHLRFEHNIRISIEIVVVFP
ncbi:hypothetical protein DM860_001434 [Cuscuta australis]|uniref:DUF7812 domain-containing protein n=1 Tax=Cuscuta australis TaxID=267555 RepID=A0A328EAC7_9ASTE|nr:hypothetical protein DM860_001434 [Cuscuta australis]